MKSLAKLWMGTFYSVFIALSLKYSLIYAHLEFLRRALKYRDMKVEEVMTLASQIFMLSVNEKLNYHVITEDFSAVCVRFLYC